MMVTHHGFVCNIVELSVARRLLVDEPGLILVAVYKSYRFIQGILVQ